MKEKEIRALYDDNSIIVYQAFNKSISRAAVQNHTFTSPFKTDRMTWIKPSFLWMMDRSGWATKENQECILAITISRKGFEWALENSCPSRFEKDIFSSEHEWRIKLKESPVRIQWDPERDALLQPLPCRSLQIGLSGMAMQYYISDWIIKIEDITDNCKQIQRSISNNTEYKLPDERLYSLPAHIKI